MPQNKKAKVMFANMARSKIKSKLFVNLINLDKDNKYFWGIL